MTSRDKQKRCTRQESPSKRRSIVTSCPRNSRISRSTRGASRLGRRLPNYMRNGKECRKNRGDKNVEKKREMFSRLRRSGSQVFAGEPSQVVKPLRQTSEEGLPVLPPGGVTPPDPEKYGTFAARWLYSQRKVMYWLGIQSKVPDTSQALYGSPGFSVK